MSSLIEVLWLLGTRWIFIFGRTFWLGDQWLSTQYLCLYNIVWHNNVTAPLCYRIRLWILVFFCMYWRDKKWHVWLNIVARLMGIHLIAESDRFQFLASTHVILFWWCFHEYLVSSLGMKNPCSALIIPNNNGVFAPFRQQIDRIKNRFYIFGDSILQNQRSSRIKNAASVDRVAWRRSGDGLHLFCVILAFQTLATTASRNIERLIAAGLELL
jgi:hypothetical protein